MPGTPTTRCSSSTRQRLLRAAAFLLAATFALPSCITAALWRQPAPRTQAFEGDRLAVFPIGVDDPDTPAAGCTALAVRLPESARRWLADHGVDSGGHEWLLLRRDHVRKTRIAWPSWDELGIWLVQDVGAPNVRWRVGELDLGEPGNDDLGTDCTATFLSEPPHDLAAPDRFLVDHVDHRRW